MEYRFTMEVTQFFSSPILKIYEPKFLNLEKKCDFYINELYKEDDLVHNSNSELFYDLDFKEFIDFISLKTSYFLDYQGFDISNYKMYFQEMWAQKFNNKGGGNHTTHIHWNSHVSGFYFIKASENTSFPVFHDPRSAALMSKLPFKDEKKVSLGSSSINFKVKPCVLFLFNSYLPHEFVVDRGKEEFKFIHWNIQMLPKGLLK